MIPSLTQPVLGICIGMQLMCLSREEGAARCKGIFPTQVLRLPAPAAAGARHTQADGRRRTNAGHR